MKEQKKCRDVEEFVNTSQRTCTTVSSVVDVGKIHGTAEVQTW